MHDFLYYVDSCRQVTLILNLSLTKWFLPPLLSSIVIIIPFRHSAIILIYFSSSFSINSIFISVPYPFRLIFLHLVFSFIATIFFHSDFILSLSLTLSLCTYICIFASFLFSLISYLFFSNLYLIFYATISYGLLILLSLNLLILALLLKTRPNTNMYVYVYICVFGVCVHVCMCVLYIILYYITQWEIVYFCASDTIFVYMTNTSLTLFLDLPISLLLQMCYNKRVPMYVGICVCVFIEKSLVTGMSDFFTANVKCKGKWLYCH